ncbi:MULTISPECIES: hypothetical protein [unclassified Bradyrhizobium]|uniref:hypothetical protein n=1 Tax=unclassified Bradyrhizobium TaxID=2631580 RepID=UPI0028EDFD56|nr:MULTISPECIES: hypothetical protein [unclassified Bradyrhizobium]
MTHFVNLQQSSQVLSRDMPINFDTIYVITQPDLDRALTKLDTVQQRLLTLHGTIWERNDTKVRADLLNQLKEIPEIRAAINNQAASHGNP